MTLRPVLSRPWCRPQSDTWSSWQNKRTLRFPCGGIWRSWAIFRCGRRCLGSKRSGHVCRCQPESNWSRFSFNDIILLNEEAVKKQPDKRRRALYVGSPSYHWHKSLRIVENFLENAQQNQTIEFLHSGSFTVGHISLLDS